MSFRWLNFKTTLLVIATATSMMASPAYSQYSSSQIDHRLERMERDMSLLQRQIYKGGSNGSYSPSVAGGAASPNTEVRIGQLEEQIRKLTGKLEEVEFNNRRLEERFNKLEQDIDGQLSTAPMAGAGSNANGAIDSGSDLGASYAVGEGTASTATTSAPTPAQTLNSQAQSDNAPADNPNSLYNYAFGMLNQTNYDGAASALQQFVTRYPDHALVGNAYYWLGETYYVRRDYVQAADSFRRGYEALPTGPKAADNILKLGMSLNAMDKKTEACVVFSQVSVQFPSASSAINQKVEREKNRIGCQ